MRVFLSWEPVWNFFHLLLKNCLTFILFSLITFGQLLSFNVLLILLGREFFLSLFDLLLLIFIMDVVALIFVLLELNFIFFLWLNDPLEVEFLAVLRSEHS